MAQEQLPLPHSLTLKDRKTLTLTGVKEVVSFDETVVALTTSLGQLVIQGQQLQLLDLSLEKGQAAVTGKICALLYEEPRQSGLRRLFR